MSCKKGLAGQLAMKDQQLRLAFKRQVLGRHFNDPKTRVIDELELRHGAARIDIAVVNGLLHGFELKGESDTLRRLPHQADVYNSIFDKVTLVAGSRHIEEAVKLVPQWWGIKIATTGKRNGIHFLHLRRACSNPCSDVLSVAKLLWKAEAINLLAEVGLVGDSERIPRSRVYARVAQVVPPARIRAFVRHQLKYRQNWRLGALQTLGDG